MNTAKKNGWRVRRAAAAVIACCLLAWSAEAAAAPRIPVGLVANLSAGGAGVEARNALLLEMARVNRRGVAGGHVFLLTLDTKGKPEAAARAVRKLARAHKAVAVIGPVEHYAAIAAAKAAEAEGITLFSLSAPEEILVPARKWVFSTASPGALPVRLILGHLKARDMRRVAIVGSSEGYGSEGREQITALAPDFGVSILQNESFQRGEHNFLPFLKRASMRGAQAFVHWARGVSRLDLVRARSALDLDMPLYFSGASPGDFTSKSGGHAAEGAVFPASWLAAADLLEKTHAAHGDVTAFREAYVRKYKSAPGETAAAAADALRLFAWSARGVGAARARIPDGLEETRNFVGLNGTYRFSKKDHNGLNADSLLLVRVEKGKWTLAGGEERLRAPAASK